MVVERFSGSTSTIGSVKSLKGKRFMGTDRSGALAVLALWRTGPYIIVKPRSADAVISTYVLERMMARPVRHDV